MDQIFAPCPSLFSYLDDHIVGSQAAEGHLAQLEQVFQILEKNGLAINLEKCIFLAPEIEFLGHQVNTEGISPTRQHVAVITAFPPPQI